MTTNYQFSIGIPVIASAANQGCNAAEIFVVLTGDNTIYKELFLRPLTSNHSANYNFGVETVNIFR